MNTVKCQDLGIISAKHLWFVSLHACRCDLLMSVNVSTSCEGALSLSNLLEIHLQKGSFLCMSLRVSFLFSVRGEGVSTMALAIAVVGSAGVVLALLHVLLWVWVAGQSRVDVTNIIIEAVLIAWVSLTSTNHERQSAVLLQAPDIHSKLILYVVSSTDHLFTLLLAFYYSEICVEDCGHCGK